MFHIWMIKRGIHKILLLFQRWAHQDQSCAGDSRISHFLAYIADCATDDDLIGPAGPIGHHNRSICSVMRRQNPFNLAHIANRKVNGERGTGDGKIFKRLPCGH